jgi:uncharacterized repeat protein (TIGR04052 family)
MKEVAMTKLTRPTWMLPIALWSFGVAACGGADDEQLRDTSSAGGGGAGDAAGKTGGSTGGAGAPKGGAGGANASGSTGGVSNAATREVKIRFRAKVLDRAFACGERYEGIGKTRSTVDPADFRFFIQDLKLVDKSGKAVPVNMKTQAPWQDAKVALIDFEDQRGACGQGTPATNDTIIGSVPAGDYNGVEFTNGVPEELNHSDPVTGPAPLQIDSALSWSWLTGFKFFIAELHQSMDTVASDADGGVLAGGVGLVHVGSNACKANEGCLHANRNLVRLMRFDPDKDVIVADIGAIFADTDLTLDAQCHSAGEFCPPLFANVGVDWTTGASAKTQTIYRIEAQETAK